jgi:hypothetical protein
MAQKITKTILLIICFIFVLGLFSIEIKDPDFWWHLKTGEYIVQTGSIPATDPFAYTSTPKDPISPESVRIKFILAQYWLSQVLFYQIYSAFGLQGIIFLRAFILTLLVFLTYRGIRREGIGFYLSLVLTVPVVLILHTFTGERPQLFSFLFSFLIIFLLEGFRKRASINNSKTSLDVIARSPEPIRDDVAISVSPQNIKERSPRPDFVEPRDDNINPIAYLIPIPFIMLSWANLHGGFIVGIGLLICYPVAEWVKYFWHSRKQNTHASENEERFRPSRNDSIVNDRAFTDNRINKNDKNEAHKNVIPVKTGIHSFLFQSTPLPVRQLKLFSAFILVSILVTLINPNTYKVIPFLAELEGGLYKSFIVETMSPLVLFRSGFYEIQFFIFFALILVTLLLFLVKMKILDLTDVVVVAGLAVISLSISRFIPFFSPVAVLMIARYGKEFTQNLPKIFETIRKNIEIPLNSFFIIVIVLMLINGDMFKSGIRGNKYPEGAAKFLKENRIAGNMFNAYVWGGYLMWSLYPDYRVFVDGRGLIPEVFFQEVRVLEASQKPVEGIPEWKAILNAYNVDFIVTFSVGNFTGRLVPLIPALLNDPGWHLIYMDNISLIFMRDSVENQEMISRYSFPKEWLWNEVAVEAALKAHDATNRGNYYETMGDAFFAKRSYGEAREAYSKALDLKPGSTRLRNQVDLLDSILRSQGR